MRSTGLENKMVLFGFQSDFVIGDCSIFERIK
jgi:hypothetical protein